MKNTDSLHRQLTQTAYTDNLHKQLKSLLIILVCFFGINTSIYSQSDIEGYFEMASSYEVGKASTVSFKITSPLDAISEITFISWSYGAGYDGNCVGTLIEGFIGQNDCTSTYTVSESPILDTYTLPFLLTDLAPNIVILNIEISFTYKKGGLGKGFASTELTVNNIKKPKITGLKSVQRCCQNLLQYKATDYGKANIFNWNVTGGAEIVEEDGNTITIKPSKNNNYNVICEVKRAEAHPFYSKTNSLDISRYNPTTSEIDGPKFLCEGDTANFTIDWEKICNAYGVEWTINTKKTQTISTSQLEIGEPFKVIPETGWVNDTVNITAQVLIKGGCIATIAEFNNIPVFDKSQVPEPDGVIQVDVKWEDDSRCGVYKLFLDFIPTEFPNGFITVSPSVFHGFPHHTKGRTSIDITVCYKNPCSGSQKCKTYEVPLPAPCEEPPMLKDNDLNTTEILTNNSVSYRNKIDMEQETFIDDNLLIFPNPFSDYITIQSAKAKLKEIKLYDINGKLIYEERINNQHKKLIMQNINSGVYILSIKTEEGSYVKKIISLK